MSETPINSCQGQFNNGKAKMYPQLDNGMQLRTNRINIIFANKFQYLIILFYYQEVN